jgi:hypothetical protein
MYRIRIVFARPHETKSNFMTFDHFLVHSCERLA